MPTNEPKTEPAAFTLMLFGPLRISIQGQPLPHLRSRKAQWLLALLALRHGRPVEREWLAGNLWPDADQDQAFASLRPVLSELRRALGDQAERLQSPGRHTLALDLVNADVDVLLFDSAIVTKKLPALKQAVSLYSGPLLEGCMEEWVPQERDSREQSCLDALQILTEAALAEGDHAAAAGYCRRAVSLDPWRDASRRGLMEALNQGGDRNAALQVYREFTELLRSDPKAVPDEKTSVLYGRLRSEAKQRTAAPDGVALAAKQAVAAPVVAGYLPQALAGLVGRESERAEIAIQLRHSRLVTLTGSGGIGKTRLAVAVAAETASQYADGAWLATLEALPKGAEVVGQIADALRLKEEADRPRLQSLTDHLRTKQLLLVLDNCEHVLESAAQVVEHLLRECAGVRVLATSREALAIAGETAWRVPSLTVPDPSQFSGAGDMHPHPLLAFESVHLFVERARAAQRHFALTAGNAAAMAQVCSRLEGIPLAIELAAARVTALTVEQIAARLDDYLGLLTGGNRAALSRRQTLRATLDWSHALLSVPEQLLLGRLSVFVGGWGLTAAERVCAGEGVEAAQVLDLLTGLVNKSLAVFEAVPAAGRGGGRYRLLEMTRQYAAERLETVGDPERIRGRHRDYFLTLAEDAESRLQADDQEVRRLEVEAANLRAALAWSSVESPATEAGLRLAGALWPFWSVRGEYSEGRQALRRALERDRELPKTSAYAKALYGAGALGHSQGDSEATRPLYEESLTIRRRLGDRRGIAEALSGLGNVARDRGDYGAARAFFEESRSLYRELEDRGNIAWSLSSLGSVAHSQGEPNAAQALFEECLGLFRELGEKRGIAWSLNNLGNIAYDRGEPALAQSLYEESLTIRRELRDRPDVAWSLSSLGSVAQGQGDYTSAQALFEESLSLFRELGERPGTAWSLRCLGDVAREQGHLAPARALYSESLGLRRELGDPRGIAWSLNGLSKAVYDQGDYALSQALNEESLSLFRQLGDRRGMAAGLEGAAAVRAVGGERSKGVRLWGAAHALRETISSPLPLKERERYERQVGQARADLHEGAFTSAWEEGRHLTWELAVMDALEEAK